MSDTLEQAGGVGGPVRTYEVSITYVEPSYARSRGIDVVPYRATLRVRAFSPAQAIEIARAQFDDLARQSSVMWLREIREVAWRLAADDAPLGLAC